MKYWKLLILILIPFEIFEIDSVLKIKKEFYYENSFGFKHNLKIVDSELSEQIFKTLYPD